MIAARIGVAAMCCVAACASTPVKSAGSGSTVAAPPVASEPQVVEQPPCPEEPRRDRRQLPDHVIELVDIAPAMTVVDLGSGSGYFLCRLSRAVGARGHVVATEVVASLVTALRKRVAQEQLGNVEVIRAPTDDVGIAPGSADRILVVDVWHHLPDRKRYAARIARALAPGGKVIVVDFKPNAGGHGIMPERVLAELAAGGFDAAPVAEQLADQYVIIGSVRRQ